MIRAVLDTNVIVSALLQPSGPPARVFLLAVLVTAGVRFAREMSTSPGWRQCGGRFLGISPVGVTDNFFDLGGDSLLVAKLLARIEQSIGKRLPRFDNWLSSSTRSLLPPAD
jgi:hypothetical protein